MDDFDFLGDLDGIEGGKNVKGYKPRFENYIDGARFNFAQSGKAQIELIQSGTGKPNKYGQPTGNWFEKLADGRFKITLKNGISTLELKAGMTYYFLPNDEAACEFIAKAIVAAEKGQFDKHFEATKREKKEDKNKGAEQVISKFQGNGAAHA